ncbi:NAD(P)/FAD-dependent oxidoreductase [Marinobacter sp. NFXS9]|uniref:NAD(P)/FAD-dependent oxidoreductase n=1 Tax=Marinobacter sp. NFXS9 TaxID=2818433 RepID=UPI0032DF3C9C
MDADVMVIGGSFAGMSAALQLVRGQRQVIVIDGRSPRNRFAAASHGFFGLDGVSPEEIHERGLEQLLRYPTARVIEGQASTAAQIEGGFLVTLASGTAFSARKLILATGLKDELPDIPGIEERWGQTVIHCPYCHGFELRNRPLGVLATSHLSAHQAGMIPDWGPTTYFTQGTFEPDPEQRDYLQKRDVTIEHAPVVEVLGEAPALSGVRLADDRVIELGGLYIGPKTRMASPLAEQLGCVFYDGPMGPVVQVDDLKQTTVQGVFAAGDMSNPMQNATLAAGSGVIAGFNAHRLLMQEDPARVAAQA